MKIEAAILARYARNSSQIINNFGNRVVSNCINFLCIGLQLYFTNSETMEEWTCEAKFDILLVNCNIVFQDPLRHINDEIRIGVFDRFSYWDSQQNHFQPDVLASKSQHSIKFIKYLFFNFKRMKIIYCFMRKEMTITLTFSAIIWK